MKPEAIIAYILKNAPVSHSSLQYRATTTHHLSITQFDKLMDKVHRHYQIKMAVKGNDVWYSQKIQKPSTVSPAERLKIWREANPYPVDDLGESPFKVCMCALWRAEDDEIYDSTKHGHLPHCDSLLFPEEYLRQNPWLNRTFN